MKIKIYLFVSLLFMSLKAQLMSITKEGNNIKIESYSIQNGDKVYNYIINKRRFDNGHFDLDSSHYFYSNKSKLDSIITYRISNWICYQDSSIVYISCKYLYIKDTCEFKIYSCGELVHEGFLLKSTSNINLKEHKRYRNGKLIVRGSFLGKSFGDGQRKEYYLDGDTIASYTSDINNDSVFKSLKEKYGIVSYVNFNIKKGKWFYYDSDGLYLIKEYDNQGIFLRDKWLRKPEDYREFYHLDY